MNANQTEIEVVKPFSDGFELMRKILFQPFDLKKWLAIGFCAWLAHLGGGGGLNFRTSGREYFTRLKDIFGQIPRGLLITSAIVLVLTILILTVLISWLRARGRFMFVDCIVKNRGAVVGPWRALRVEGNSYFFFSLLVGFAFWIFVTLTSLPIIIFAIRSRFYFSIRRDQIAGYFIPMIAAWVFLILLFVMAWGLVSNFMVPVMYRHRGRADEAFRTVTRLIVAYPGEIVFYCLFWAVLAIATVLIACLAICLTCCIAALPYVGTVILLPMYATFRGFSLCYLRQFGSDYDVWATPAEPPPPLPQIS